MMTVLIIVAAIGAFVAIALCMAADPLANQWVPLTLVDQVFTVATVPPAASYKGRLINVSNGAAGANCLAWSDGTNWKVIALGATISAT